jgi:hypothetical protein
VVRGSLGGGPGIASFGHDGAPDTGAWLVVDNQGGEFTAIRTCTELLVAKQKAKKKEPMRRRRPPAVSSSSLSGRARAATTQKWLHEPPPASHSQPASPPPTPSASGGGEFHDDAPLPSAHRTKGSSEQTRTLYAAGPAIAPGTDDDDGGDFFPGIQAAVCPPLRVGAAGREGEI